MKTINLKLMSFSILLALLTTACQNKQPVNESPKTSSADLQIEIKKQVDSLYHAYEKFGYDWIDFYTDEFTAIYPDTPVKLTKRDSLITQWEGIYKKYNVQLVDRGEPTVIESEDMAISYNSFNEIFINKETNDTIKSVGTYIVAWKRQPNNTWKIVFETLHNE